MSLIKLYTIIGIGSFLVCVIICVVSGTCNRIYKWYKPPTELTKHIIDYSDDI